MAKGNSQFAFRVIKYTEEGRNYIENSMNPWVIRVEKHIFLNWIVLDLIIIIFMRSYSFSFGEDIDTIIKLKITI